MNTKNNAANAATNVATQQDPTKETPAKEAAPTDDKSFVDKIIEGVPGMVKKSEGKPEEEVTPTEDGAEADASPQREASEAHTKAVEEKLGKITKTYEDQVKKLKNLLPNTKDPAKKLEMEREIFEKEKELYELTRDLKKEDPPEFGKLNTFFKENDLGEDTESYKIAQKMLSYGDGAADLIKIYLAVGNAVKKDMEAKQTKSAPVDINSNVKDVASGSTKAKFAEEGSMVDEIIKSLNK